MENSDKILPQLQALTDDDDIDIEPDELHYSLEIVQQPLRARMCGFGNKDRRNITPAPVLKLVARLPDGRVVPASHLSKQSFVVTADLWMEDEVTERNLVLVASIPSSRSAAYSQQHQQQQQQLYAAQTKESQQDHLDIQHQLIARTAAVREGGGGAGAGAGGRVSVPTTAAPVSIDTHLQGTSNATGILIDNSGPSTPTSVASSLSSSPPKSMPRPIRTASGATRVRDLHDNKGAVPYQHDNKETEINEEGQERGHQGDVKMEEDPAYHSDDAKYVDSEIYELKELERRAGESGRMELSTRNLVGQIAVCGQIAPGLHDDTTHIWFAFSILSIRTEGFFKLRFCLSDLQRIPVGGTSTTICEVFSNTFHVQTPKRFDGTVDNNDIAVHLNKNGIKIPARKDEKKFNKNRNNNIKNIS